MTFAPVDQMKLLLADAAEVIPEAEFADKLASERPLRVKLGLDPTAEHVTLGWAVVLRKLRQFQDFGHTAVLIIGDFTAQIGDPSGKDEARPMLTKDEVDAHAEHVLRQFDLILSPERLEVRRNSEWLEPLGVAGLLAVATNYTVARMLERNDFAERYAEGTSISMREFMYPLLQGYDSVAVEADVELGGTDQHFNLIVGRHLQRAFGQEPQVLLEMPLLEGTDGVKKMGQSVGNYIGITEAPEEIFGKLMRIPDTIMDKYFRLTTDLPDAEIAKLREELPPQALKRVLASEVVKLYHGEKAALAAAERFDRLFVEHRPPDDVAERSIPPGCVRDRDVQMPNLLKELGLAKSTSDARRKIEQGGVYVDGVAITSEAVPEADVRGRLLQVGKRHFVRLV
jgi:tyrosyl-tRNA synthetase